MIQDAGPYREERLPPGIRSRFIDGINGLRMHLLEAGFESPGRPLVVLLHGFPELAYSWRKVMAPLAGAGYHVVAPDLRGYGRTTGWDGDYDGDLSTYRFFNLVRDVLTLIEALGHDRLAALIGHDFGSVLAADCALVRPDVFNAVVLMSAPYGGPPSLLPAPREDIQTSLAALDRPRKHYQWYYTTAPANGDMLHCAQGVHDFLRAYYHHKSADWPGNEPYPLAAWTADELAKLPTYYVMDLADNMAETVAKEMPSSAEIAACAWLPDDELAIYAGEFSRTGFQGGLNWYRSRLSPTLNADEALFAGRGIDIPAAFIAGSADWGIHQAPGVLERMQSEVCKDFRGLHLLDGAGHWVQQEQPQAVADCLLSFIGEL